MVVLEKQILKLVCLFFSLNPGNYGEFQKEEIILTSETEDDGETPPHDMFENGVTEICIDGQSDDLQINQPHYDNINFVKNKYISANDNNDCELAWNIAYSQQSFLHSIGMHYDLQNTEIKFNKNIFFNQTKDIQTEKFRNMVRWSDVGSDAIPDLFFKKIQEPVIKIIDAPSFYNINTKIHFLYIVEIVYTDLCYKQVHLVGLEMHLH